MYELQGSPATETWKTQIIEHWNRKDWTNAVHAIQARRSSPVTDGAASQQPEGSYSKTSGPRILTHLEGVAQCLNGDYGAANRLFNEACKPEPDPYRDPLAVASLSWLGDCCLLQGDKVNALAAWSAAVRNLNKINPKGCTVPVPPDMSRGQQFLRQILWHLRSRLRSLYPYEILLRDSGAAHWNPTPRVAEIMNGAKSLSSSENIPVQLLVGQMQDPWSIEIGTDIFDWPPPIGKYWTLNQDQFLAPHAALLYSTPSDLELRKVACLLRPKETLMNALNALAQMSGRDTLEKWGLKLLNTKDHVDRKPNDSESRPYRFLLQSSTRGVQCLATITVYIVEGVSEDMANLGHVTTNTMCADIYCSQSPKLNRFPADYFRFFDQNEQQALYQGFTMRLLDYLVEVGLGDTRTPFNGRPSQLLQGRV